MIKIRTLFSIIAGKDNIEDIIEAPSDKKIIAQTPGASKEFIFADKQKVIEEHRAYSDKINSLLDIAMRNYQQGQYDAAISGYDEFFMVLKEADAHLEKIKKDINEWLAQPHEKNLLHFTLSDIQGKDSTTIIRDNTLASAYVMRANANLKLKKPDEALHDFQEASKYDPKRENVQEMINSLEKELAVKEKAAAGKDVCFAKYASRRREINEQLKEARKRLAKYKEPDYGPIETFDDTPDAGKSPPEDLKAKLAKYEAIGTQEELALAKRSKGAADELVQRINAEKQTDQDIDTSAFDELVSKKKPHQTDVQANKSVSADTKTDWTPLVLGIIMTVLIGVGTYFISQTIPAGKSKKEQEYVRTYLNDNAYHIDAIVNGTAYAMSDAKDKDISKYQLVVRKILANQEDFRMDIAKDALEDFLRFSNAAEMYDKENKTFDFGRGYYPREFVKFAQAVADDSTVITKGSLNRIKEKVGYKQIVGEK